MGKKAPLTREEQIGVGENYAILQDKMTEIYGVSDRIPKLPETFKLHNVD